jgi:hypothetical protein
VFGMTKDVADKQFDEELTGSKPLQVLRFV